MYGKAGGNLNDEALLKQWESLGISNDFIFCKVMENEELLAELIHLILPDIEFTDLTIVSQKAEKDGLDTHGVRFDIFVKDGTGRVIEIEMQVLNTGNLPLRIRFYCSMIDTQMLAPSESYSKLKDRYVIMICPFDPFRQGRHFYSFTTRCDQDYELQLGDKSVTIVLSAAGTMDDVSDKLRAFLDYVAGRPSDDEYVQKLEAAVKKAKANKEWRRDYMTARMRDLENQEIGEQNAKNQMILNMVEDGLAPEKIAKYADVTVDYVVKIKNGELKIV